MREELRPDVFIVLVFPNITESRWVYKPPRLGARIDSSLGEKWKVTEVLRSGIQTYTVFCGAPTRGVADGRDLAADLLERARKAGSPLERRRRDYFP